MAPAYPWDPWFDKLEYTLYVNAQQNLPKKTNCLTMDPEEKYQTLSNETQSK